MKKAPYILAEIENREGMFFLNKVVLGILLDITITEIYQVDDTTYQLYNENHSILITVDSIFEKLQIFAKTEGYKVFVLSYDYVGILNAARSIMIDIEKTKMLKYPYFGVRGGLMVAFVGKSKGVVVATDRPYDSNIGMVADNWTESAFENLSENMDTLKVEGYLNTCDDEEARRLFDLLMQRLLKTK